MDHTQKADNVNFYSDPDYEYIIKAKRKYKETYGRYSMVGKLRHKNTRKVYMDLFDRLCTVSKSAIIIFNEIKANLDPEIGIAVMAEWKDLDASQRRANNRRLAELKEIDLVLKVRHVKGIVIPPAKYSYMVNPYLMIPWQFDDAKKVWKALKFTYEKECIK